MGQRQRYRVVLDVTSNFEGEPDRDVEVKTIKSYLESVAGVGSIDVSSVEPLPSAEPPVPSIPIPVIVETVPGPPPVPPPVVSWTPESPTRKDLKRKGASRRPKKM